MYASGFFDDARLFVYGVCPQRVDVWGRNIGDKSRGVLEVASRRKENAENDLWRLVTLKDRVENAGLASFETDEIEVVRTCRKKK